MQVVLYFDVYPGMDLGYAAAYANPTPKMDNAVRYRFVLDIEDPFSPDIDLGNVLAKKDDGMGDPSPRRIKIKRTR